ncbi:DUF4287 domain-containing protein [Nocardioides sp.]|nr:DUF4287 domain-containing protein [Nocardioides sp.]
MTDQVKGPASYFPSIEKKYGRPIAEWKPRRSGSASATTGAASTWSSWPT